MIAVNSLILVVSSIKNHQNCHTNTLSHPPPVTTSSIEIHSHLMSNKNKSYKTNHIHTKFRYFMNDIYKQSSDSHNPMSNSSKVLKTLLQSLKNKRNRAKLLTNMHNKTRLRIRRNLLRESNMNNENLYDADDRNYLRNRQEDINEQRRGFDEEYYLPIETNLKMSKSYCKYLQVNANNIENLKILYSGDSNDLYDDEIDRMNNIHVDNEQRQADKKIMQVCDLSMNTNRMLGI